MPNKVIQKIVTTMHILVFLSLKFVPIVFNFQKLYFKIHYSSVPSFKHVCKIIYRSIYYLTKLNKKKLFHQIKQIIYMCVECFMYMLQNVSYPFIAKYTNRNNEISILIQALKLCMKRYKDTT